MDEARALRIVAALLIGASSSAGFVGGRMTAPEPPAEVRLVRLPPRIVRVPVEIAPIEPKAAAAEESTPAPPAAPAPAVPPESVPVAPAPPKVEAKPKHMPPKPAPKAQPKPQPKPEREQPARKPRPPSHKAALPSCAVVKREYDAMSWSQRMSAYRSASQEEIAHGKRCLGF